MQEFFLLSIAYSSSPATKKTLPPKTICQDFIVVNNT